MVTEGSTVPSVGTKRRNAPRSGRTNATMSAPRFRADVACAICHVANMPIGDVGPKERMSIGYEILPFRTDTLGSGSVEGGVPN